MSITATTFGDIDARKHDRDISCSPSPRNHSTISKKRRKDARVEKPFRGPDLPPLLWDDLDPQSTPMPQFATTLLIPSLKSVASLAGTGCCCGFTCACPGCVEHRAPLASSESTLLKDCADGCGHCVDNQAVDDTFTAPPHTVMKEFLARAASLPVPPPNRFVNLDPTNITVFPTDIFTREDKTYLDGDQQIRAAWGLVDVPKLDCCKGMCGCPDGNCGCGKSCGGCCAADDHDEDSPAAEKLISEQEVERDYCCRK
jgi:hypothetical protein